MDRVEQMYQAVKQKVLDLEIDPTQPIDEKTLVRETGGSLTLIQQALDRLAEDGLVEKLAGDSVAAFWGAGFAGPDYVRRTVKVAQELNRQMERQHIPVGIGVHSGIAYFGALGTADGLTDITAIGDEVNVAARLASKAGAGEIILSEQALKKAGIDGSELESRSLELKGISGPVSVRVLSSDGMFF